MYLYQSEIFRSGVGKKAANVQFNEWMVEHKEEIYGIEKLVYQADNGSDVICLFYRQKEKPEFKPTVSSKEEHKDGVHRTTPYR